MDPIEEQKQEIEILQSIYPDELELENEKAFTINLPLETDADRDHAIKLGIRYPPTYPEVVPTITVEAGDVNRDEEEEEEEDDEDEDVDEDAAAIRDAKRAINLIETVDLDREDFKKLEKRLVEEAELNIGMPSAFTLASVLKDEAEQLFAEKVKVERKKLEETQLAREREEQKKFIGTKVTPESFAAWRTKFREEMGYDTRMKERYDQIHQGKLTGKEIFDRGLAGDAADIIDDESTAVDGVTKGLEKTEI